MMLEYHAIFETAKSAALHELHANKANDPIDPHVFTGKTVIIVNDFANTGTTFHAAIDFLKPIKTEKLVLVTAVARVNAVDAMHLLGDKLLIMHTTDKDFPSEHYFADNSVD
jgi:predicted phosphoribosyltransferase